MSASSKKKAKPKVKKAAAKGKAKPKAPAPKKAQKVVAPEERPKKTVVKEKKAPEAKQPTKPAAKPVRLELGTPPDATVAARHVDSMHERRARGFSFGELASAGVPLDAARRAGLSLDVRRRSVVEENVEALKGWLGSSAGGSKKQAAVATAAKKS